MNSFAHFDIRSYFNNPIFRFREGRKFLVKCKPQKGFFDLESPLNWFNELVDLGFGDLLEVDGANSIVVFDDYARVFIQEVLDG